MNNQSIYSAQVLADVTSPLFEEMSKEVIKIAKLAGDAILSIYHSPAGFTQNSKKDNSPVTEADLASDKIIRGSLLNLTPDIPILSEESLVDFTIRQSWTTYWLIDPLDGTREFIKKNGEFTVNIALIMHGRPIFGVIHAPDKGDTYWGFNKKAFKSNGVKTTQITPLDVKPVKISVSRSHRCSKIDELLKSLSSYEIKTIGSSLKFCWIAEGEVQYYPRANSISLWDIAAGEAIVIASGANMTDWEGNLIDYTPKPTFEAPPFKAWFGTL